MDQLDARRLKLLRYIASCCDQGASPTYREMMEEFEITSTQGIRYHIEVLQEAGVITVLPKMARGIRLTPKGRKLL